VITFAMLPRHAAAQLDEPARFEYRIGGQAFSEFTSRVRLDSPNRGLGTQIRLEDDVNLEERVSPCSMYQRSPVSRSIAAWTAALKASEFSILSLWLAPSRPLRGCPALLRDAAARIRIEAADESEDLGMVLIPSSVELGDLLADRRVRVVGEIEGDEVGHERQADRVRL